MIRPDTYASLGELLCDALIQFKSETALVEIDRKVEKHRWSYLDVRREVAKVVAWLDGHGIGPGDRVGIVMSNQSRWLVAAIAIFHRGAVLVPIDYKLSESEQRALLKHADARALFTEQGYHQRFKETPVASGLVLVEGSDAAGSQLMGWGALPDAPPLGPPVARTRQDIACLVYSSGTGGRPKGCLLPHGAYLSQIGALMELYPLRPGHSVFSVLPTNHAIDFMVCFVGPFSCGATVVHQRTLRSEFLLPTMKSERITHMALVPSLLAGMVRSIEERLDERPAWQNSAVKFLGAVNEILTRDAPDAPTSRRLLSGIHDALGGHLELLFCGGAFVDRGIAEKLYRWGLPVAIGYGLTECCTVATVNDMRPFRADSVGHAVKGVELRILNPGEGGVGEVLIRGATLMQGYHQDPELTAEVLDADGWLHTGDLGHIDASGHLHLVGRAKNMIVTAGGKNVYPEDVEGTFEGVAAEDLTVFASGYLWPGAHKLEDEILIAVVRAKKGTEPAALLEQIRVRNRRLPEYKRLGGVLLTKTEFPRTASLKVKRHELRAQLAGTSPNDLHRFERASHVEAMG
jgi:long-chain acyl-CoA synthetase